MDNIKEEKKIETEEVIEKTDGVDPEVEVDGEAELDKILEDSIESVKAGNVLIPLKKEEVKSEELKEAAPEVLETEDTSTPPLETKEGEEVKPEGYEFRIPNKGKFESDESFEKRIQLLDLVKKRKLAKTPEQIQEISGEIKTTKNQLKTLNGTDRFVNPLNEKAVGEPIQPVETQKDEDLEADKERLKQLGGATKEDIQEIIKKERLAADVKSTLDNFVSRYADLADEDTREVFFDFVDSNYKWQGKGGNDLMTVLELARESMFKPSESIQERVLKGANVQEKVNAMQFPGGTVAKTDFSPDMRKDIDEIMATGLSEEKAIELLSD